MVWYIRIYGLDVKDRVRAESHPKHMRDRTRPYMARGCGAIVSLANRYRTAIVSKKKDLTKGLSKYI